MQHVFVYQADPACDCEGHCFECERVGCKACMAQARSED
jgi:hypothetical protein